MHLVRSLRVTTATCCSAEASRPADRSSRGRDTPFAGRRDERRGAGGRDQQDSGLAELGVAAAAPASEGLRLAQRELDRPDPAPQSQVERAGGRFTVAKMSDAGDLFPAHENRVGERERIDHHDPRGHEHEEPASQGVERADHRKRHGKSERAADDAGDDATIGEQQRAAARARADQQDRQRNRSDQERWRRTERKSHLVSVPDRVGGGWATRRRQREPVATMAVDPAAIADAAVVLVARRERQDNRGGRDDPQRGETPRPRRGNTTSPIAHADHKNTAATHADSDQLASASPSAPPADTGSNTHARRASHNEGNAFLASFDGGRSSYPTRLMPDKVLVSGIATAIGSLPHHDAAAAAALVLRCIPELPAAPELPMRTPLEGVVAEWARAIDGIDVRADGTLVPVRGSTGAPRSTRRSTAMHTAACSPSSMSPRPNPFLPVA